MSVRAAAWAACLALACAPVAGCGDSGPSDEEQVRQVVGEFGKATAAKDYQALCDRILAPGLVDQLKQIGLPCEVALAQGLGDVRDPRVTSALVGARTVEQLEDSLGALDNLDFTADELAEIDKHAVEAGINLWAASSDS